MTATIDFKAQAREFAEWLLNLQGKGRRRRFNDAIVRGHCPRPDHDDKHPSFSFNSEMDAFACSCSRGKGSELREVLGWKPSNGSVPYSRPGPAFGQSKPPDRPADDVYRYANRNEKLKWRMAGSKSVIQWRHAGVIGMQGDPGIYRLDEALKAADVVHMSESESDADALAELGLVAIATPHGAASPWKELPKELARRQLVVWEHQDEAGRKYAAAVADVAKRGGADAVIARPAAPHKDVREWILAGATKDALEGIATTALFDFPLAEPADELLAADLPPPDYVIQPVAIRGNLTLIQGEPKAGKSIITLFMAMCAALGIWPAGRWSVPRPIRVLYITWEDPRRRIQKRLRQFLLGLGQPFKPVTSVPNLFFYSKSKGPRKAPRIRLETPEGRHLLQKLIQAHKAELVVLDTLSHLKAIDENAVEKMQPVMDALTDICEETDCAIAFNHHTGKEGKANKKSTTYRSRGSSVIPAAADVILSMGDRGKTHQTPCEMISREDDNDGFVLEYLPEGEEIVRFKLVEEVEEDETEKYGAQKKMIEALSKLVQPGSQGANHAEIAKESGLPLTTVRRTCRRLVDEGLILRKLTTLKHGKEWRYANLSHVFPVDGGTP
jgi:hypothetical protein